MLSISLISLLIAVPLFSYRITPSLFNRITCVTLLYASFLSFYAYSASQGFFGAGVGVYNGLFHVTNISMGIEAFIFLVGALILLGWASRYTEIVSRLPIHGATPTRSPDTATPTIPEYSLMILFTTIGASLLVSSSDLVSMFLSIELQSFAVYVLATLYRNSESATAAGLKYFLLGGLSSALILLGTALIFTSTGLTQFEAIYNLVSVSGTEDYMTSLTLGMLLIGIGFLFKVASAPFHNWAPDVYDGTPTIVTSWLSTMPKISIFAFLLELQSGMQLTDYVIQSGEPNAWKTLLLTASLLSLIVGTVLGLSQSRIKRLLTYSTISHVGFLLLALAINSEESIESFLFYLFQYSLTNLNVFLVLLAFGYAIHNMSTRTEDISLIQQLQGEFQKNPLLSLSFALCLFSMAGIPPLVGFFAKQMVLYSSTHAGYYFMSIVAIIVSVISASYYLKIIQVMFFSNSEVHESSAAATEQSNVSGTFFGIRAPGGQYKELGGSPITTMHSTLIAVLTAIITLFVFQPSILLNACHLLALSLFYY